MNMKKRSKEKLATNGEWLGAIGGSEKGVEAGRWVGRTGGWTVGRVDWRVRG